MDSTHDSCMILSNEAHRGFNERVLVEVASRLAMTVPGTQGYFLMLDTLPFFIERVVSRMHFSIEKSALQQCPSLRQSHCFTTSASQACRTLLNEDSQKSMMESVLKGSLSPFPHACSRQIGAGFDARSQLRMYDRRVEKTLAYASTLLILHTNDLP